MVKPPDPIRTPKLSTIGPAQYCGGGPRGNRRCLFVFTFLPNSAQRPLKFYQTFTLQVADPVAQWLRRVTTNHEIEGSSPSRVGFFGLTARLDTGAEWLWR